MKEVEDREEVQVAEPEYTQETETFRVSEMNAITNLKEVMTQAIKEEAGEHEDGRGKDLVVDGVVRVHHVEGTRIAMTVLQTHNSTTKAYC